MQKTKDREILTPLQSGVKSGAPEGQQVPASLVVLLMNAEMTVL
jgi:hypothetical protein